MNKKEYYNNRTTHKTFEYKYVQELLHQWKIDNNYTCKCVVHHRCDTEETIRYNEEHYELWGFNLDGTFEYGKYVVFMTNAEHTTYHRTGSHLTEETRKKIGIANKGRQGPMKGKHHSGATTQKMSQNHMNADGENNPMYGKKHTNEAKSKMSKNHADVNGENNPMYGKKHTEKARMKISASHLGIHPTNEAKAKMSTAHKAIGILWDTYKNNDGKLSWDDFRHALKNGNITFEARPISVFVK